MIDFPARAKAIAGKLKLNSCATFYAAQDIEAALRAVAEQVAKEVCICAAVLTKEGVIFRGHRHDDAITTAGKAGYHPSSLAATQGFITSRGRYVDREEGARLQAAAGIVSAHTGQLPEGMLFSEDLYMTAALRSGAKET